VTRGAILRRIGRSPRLNIQLAVQRLARRWRVEELDIPLDLLDLADSGTIAQPLRGHAPAVDRVPRVAWLALPAAAGSGGHTTLFRMMRAAQEAGFHNTLLFYNRFDADLTHYANVVRQAWPWLICDIAGVEAKIEGFDACVASSWATAHVLAKRADNDAARLYFIQDYEPYFYPRGETYAFAEDTYRFGFLNIALGEMIQSTLDRELSVSSELVPFGADTTVFRLDEPQRPRAGVAFYARPGTDRRGYRLAVLALTRFHEKHPTEPIHVYGTANPQLPFPAINHGTISPEQLSELYNSVVAGLALSFTNVSLAPEEMLASGAIPVVNEHPDARAVLKNQYVEWARATPSGLADALSKAVSRTDILDRAKQASLSVSGRSWRPTEEAVVRVLAAEVGAELEDGHIVSRQ